MKRAYLTWGYPEVYRDLYAPFYALGRALELPDLMASQRDALIAVLIESRFEYDELSENLVETTDIQHKYDHRMQTGLERRVEMAEAPHVRARASREHERVEFQRSEINSRAVWMMELILSDDQIKACRPPRIRDRVQ